MKFTFATKDDFSFLDILDLHISEIELIKFPFKISGKEKFADNLSIKTTGSSDWESFTTILFILIPVKIEGDKDEYDTFKPKDLSSVELSSLILERITLPRLR